MRPAPGRLDAPGGGVGDTPAPGAPPRLDNMSCRPNVAVVHPSDDPSRQLVPALGIRFGDGARTIASARELLRLLGGSRRLPCLREVDAARRLDAVAVAVGELLGLPSVLPLAVHGAPPLVETRSEPLLAWTLHARRSGPVWLARRPCAPAAGLAWAGQVTVLVGPDLRDRILAALDGPAWRERVFERARALEPALRAQGDHR